MSNRRALCVGINNFENYPGAALQGCVNDAHAMSGLLQKLLGFQKDDITMLTDAQATKEGIMECLTSMVSDAKAGKCAYLVFSLSSHGTQVPDLNDDEEQDFADEAFCPYDLAQKGNQWDLDHIIVDDELRDLFQKLPEKVLLEVYLDTCHSGTGLRDIDMLFQQRRPRFLSPPSLEAFKQLEGKRPRSLHRAMMEKRIVHHILWSGCQANQTSADAYIDGSWHGAFTYYFCKEMYACNNRLSRKKVLAKVRADLVEGRYTQIPQLESQATSRNAIIS
jgi:metacaspase-1